MYILDSERSDKYITFTMMCIFFYMYYVYTIIRLKTKLMKVNLVGNSERSKFKMFRSFQKRLEKEKPVFDKISTTKKLILLL